MQLLASPISYSEICKYETSMTMNILSEIQDNGFVQFVFDNADHNTRTMDGMELSCDGRSAVCYSCFSCSDMFFLYSTVDWG
ncbi:hypothetical protein AVEN_65039-1 [Araneus ventricosus]|uniref:Uncharacterized protein n=1 Tax=Araneus ventricosus TaxID=182803 RepID=A0A4Y2VP78_ARAVE|nr:hypothetical protein AVEN_65039-1 [Araneus ventricosus]